MANEPKPLMIRGDRLLLALDVLEFCYSPPLSLDGPGTVENPRGFSWTRTTAALKRLGIDVRGNATVPGCAAYDFSVKAARALLRSAADHIAMVPFDAEDFIAHVVDWRIVAERRTATQQVIRLIFRLIASGEITEVDFKEGTCTQSSPSA